jgi:predicted secreted hydrolase
MKNSRGSALFLKRLVPLAIILTINAPGASDPYRLALPNYKFEFPRDHFNHPEFQTEWWYYTGNVRTAQGRRFGFDLTFFRQAVDRQSAPQGVWDLKDVWMAHLALSDLDGGQFLHTERLNRAGPGVAGADVHLARVWNGNWQAQWTMGPGITGGGSQLLQGIAGRFSFELSLRSEKPPVINGENGVSQKAAGIGKASHYISLTRLATSGKIVLDGKQYTVEGVSWMDHEFFSHQLDGGQSGWDWFSLQLEDRTELMLFRLRRRDGSRGNLPENMLDPYSAGTYVDSGGSARHLGAADFTLKPGKTWTSAATGGSYPVEWVVEVPSLHLNAAIHTPLAQQEFTGGTTYWEGAIDISATRAGRHLSGVGYLEMTGYVGRIIGLD